MVHLRLSVFSPDDYVCRKGDVGTEMYIIKSGFLDVVADDGRTVYATLGEGSFFGEASLLNIPGNRTGNRRSANVRSIGYSDIFVLSKDDLWSTLEEYPAARQKLIEAGRDRLRQGNLFDEQLAATAAAATGNVQLSLRERVERMTDQLDEVAKKLGRLMAVHESTQIKLRRRICLLESRLIDEECDKLA